jgi:hypothetical protein
LVGVAFAVLVVVVAGGVSGGVALSVVVVALDFLVGV